MVPIVVSKHPSATLDIAVSFANQLATGETIVSATATVAGAPPPVATTGTVELGTVTYAQEATGAGTFTFQVNCIGPNGYLLLQFAGTDSGPTIPPTANGRDMTLVGAAAHPSVNYDYSSVWELVAPDLGSNSIVIAYGSGNAEAAAFPCASVHQTTPSGTFASATGYTSAPAVSVTSATGDLAIAFLAAATVTPPVTSAGTERWIDSGGLVGGAGSTLGGGGTAALSWSLDDTYNWVAVAVAIKPVTL